MDVVLVAATAFVGAVALDSVIEVGAEISAGWSGTWMDHYFWDVQPDPNGSESQRLSAELVARVPDGDGYRELCRVPLTPRTGVEAVQ